MYWHGAWPHAAVQLPSAALKEGGGWGWLLWYRRVELECKERRDSVRCEYEQTLVEAGKGGGGGRWAPRVVMCGGIFRRREAW